MAALTAIALTALAASIGSQIKQYEDADTARNEASRSAAAAQTQQDKLIADAKQTQNNATAVQTANQARDTAAVRKNKLASAGAGRGSTILTSPLGAVAASNTATKTLLGM